MSEMLKRFDALTKLQDGWLDGEGIAPDAGQMALVAQKFAAYYPKHAPLPVIAPTPQGNILLEWNLPGYPTVDIFLNESIAQFHCLAGDATEVAEVARDFSLTDDNAWKQFFVFLSEQIKH